MASYSTRWIDPDGNTHYFHGLAKTTYLSDGKDVEAALENKASKGSYEKYDLPLENGFTAPLDCYYTKSENNEVKVLLYCLKDSPFEKGTINTPIFTLPRGFRPPRAIETPASMCASPNKGYTPNIIRIENTGIGRVLFNFSEEDLVYTIAHITFFTD